jgi:hypothetical protein
MNFIFSACFYGIIFLGFLDFFLLVFFHLRLTDRVIELLRQEGFLELSSKLHRIIAVLGKFPIKGANDAVQFFRTWKEFYNLRISKRAPKLYILHCLYKTIHIIFIAEFVILLAPIAFLVVWLIRR